MILNIFAIIWHYHPARNDDAGDDGVEEEVILNSKLKVLN
jgi:hypothetical protein